MTVGYIDIKRIDLSSLTLVDGTYSFIYPSYRMKVKVVCFFVLFVVCGELSSCEISHMRVSD